jgi:CBS domain containing-hemolysin-like protein
VNELLILVLLLLLSGVFSGSETALVSLTIARAEALKNEGRAGANALVYLKRNPSRMLITILIGNNVVNIAASAMATVIATRWFGDVGPGIAVGVLTILILVFGEITPKSLATRYAERISLVISPVMFGLMRLLGPFVWLFDRLTRTVQHMTGADADPTVTESELISLAEYGEQEGAIEADEREMIERVFILNDLKVSDVMTPRGDVFALSGDHALNDVLNVLAAQVYTRIPIYRKDRNEIERILYLRDVLDAVARGETGVRLWDIAHEPLYFPENVPIDETLSFLRKRNQHMAIVVDEHGAMQGVVTLEDLLEELVGEIYDESDDLPEELMTLPNGRIVVDGGAELRVVEKFFALDLPGKPTDTVSRWLLGHTERIPAEDERFEFDGLEVRIQGATHSRIERVILGRATSPEDAA